MKREILKIKCLNKSMWAFSFHSWEVIIAACAQNNVSKVKNDQVLFFYVWRESEDISQLAVTSRASNFPWSTCSGLLQLQEREAVSEFKHVGLTSGTQEAPAHIDGRGEEAVPLGAAVAAADHDVMGEDDAARRHAAISRVIGHRTADTTHQTTWTRNRGEG